KRNAHLRVLHSFPTRRSSDLAGLQAGDKITAINGAPVTGWHQFRRIIQEGREVALTVQRGQGTLKINSSPEKQQNDSYWLGFSRSEEHTSELQSLTNLLCPPL